MFTAAAITANGDLIPFGPDFHDEETAWYWLQFECDFEPVHTAIDVFTKDALKAANWRREPEPPTHLPYSEEIPF